MTITRHNANRITVRKDGRALGLGRSSAEGRFVTESEPDEAILKPLLRQARGLARRK